MLNILLIPLYGTLGVAIATVSTWVTLYIFSYRHVKKHIGYTYRLSSFKQLLIPASSFLALVVLHHTYATVLPSLLNYIIIFSLNIAYILYCFKMNILPTKILSTYIKNLLKQN